jgi:hypothetical protein
VTADEFRDRVGSEPCQDDLERCNCVRAGQLGHMFCGVCVHGMPRFVRCDDCAHVGSGNTATPENSDITRRSEAQE